MTKPINSSVFKPNAIIKSSVNKSISSPSPKAEIEKRSNEDSYYDEDFEEFDEFSAKSNEPELQNITKAIHHENSKVVSKHASILQKSNHHPPHKIKKTDSELPLEKASLHASLSNITKSSKISSMIKRAQDISKLLTLDLAIYDNMLDLGPKTEYELMRRSRLCNEEGTQVQVVTGDVAIETEDWEICDVWTQAPPDLLVESAHEQCPLPWLSSDSNLSSKKKKEKKKNEKMGVYTPRLGDFLKRATPLLDLLLMEESSHYDNEIDDIFETNEKRSSADHSLVLKYSHPVPSSSFLQNTILQFTQNLSYSTNHTLLAFCYFPSTTAKSSKSSKIPLLKSLITLQSSFEVPETQAVVYGTYDSITTLYIPSSTPFLLLGGSKEGNVVVWDTRQKTNRNIGDIIWPCFISEIGSHLDGICGIIGKGEEAGVVKKGFNVYSIDEGAKIQSWVGIVEDEGLSLVRGEARLLYSPSQKLKRGNMVSTSHFKSLHSFLGVSETGVLSLHSTATTISSSHATFSSKTYSPDITAYTISTLDPFPFSPHTLFSVGYEEGRICIYSIETTKPIYRIQLPLQKTSKFMKWSRWRPTVLYILDIDSTFYVYDFSLDKDDPVFQYKLKETTTAEEDKKDQHHYIIGMEVLGKGIIGIFDTLGNQTIYSISEEGGYDFGGDGNGCKLVISLLNDLF